MYRRIVVPLDGSTLAEDILPVVSQLAGKLSQVELLAVVDREALGYERPSAYRSSVFSREAVAIAEVYLKSIAGRLQVPAAQVKMTVTVEGAAEGITRVADAEPDTLIALSTHGLSGTGRFTLGTVATRVVLDSRGPVLVYRPRHEDGQAETVGTAIVPLDGSRLAEHVLGTVEDLAKGLGLQVLLLRVHQAEQESLGLGADWVSVNAGLIETVYSYLTEKERELKQAGVKVKSEYREGTAADTIIELVQQIPNAFVIIATHGKSGLGKAVLGSVARRVVGDVNAPVLLLRA